MISRVVSSSGRIKFLDLRAFCRDLHIFIVETWPWVLFGESLHRLIDHSWEYILLNGTYGLANKSESSCESVHKCEVFSREHLARKTNLSHNLEDVFCRQHLSGDPGIREKDKPVRQIGLSIDILVGQLFLVSLLMSCIQVKCTRCRSKEHYTVACPQKTVTVTRRDDALVNSFLLTTIEEEPKEQATFMKNLKDSWNI